MQMVKNVWTRAQTNFQMNIPIFFSLEELVKWQYSVIK